MSGEARDALVDHILKSQPQLTAFVRDQKRLDMLTSWDLLAYSFQKGFEALWDQAKAGPQNGLLERPLLALWRQSVELSIKSAIETHAGESALRPIHDLVQLFADLLRHRADLGMDDANDHAREVATMIAHIQGIDPHADRFRYPRRKGTIYTGLEVDLDELFQAHWIITTWCDGAATEFEEQMGAPY